VDTSLFNFQAGEFDDVEGDLDPRKERSWGVGPLASAPGGALPAYAAFSIGYAWHRHVVAALQVSYGAQAYETKQGFYGKEENKTYTIMLRPVLQIPFNPQQRVVLSGFLGLDLRWFRQEIDSDWEGVSTTQKGTAKALVFGLAMHAFLNEWSSLDVGAAYSELIMHDSWEEGGITRYSSRRYRGRTLGLTLGVSLWL
jgi:hypothetical protein